MAKASLDTLASSAITLGVDRDDLDERLTTRIISIGREDVVIPLIPEDAAKERDALAKAVYQRCFEYLVQGVGELLRPCAAAKMTQEEEVEAARRRVGLLDVFGFESLARNSLEQLCINFANERLHALFLSHVFEGCPTDLIQMMLDDAMQIDNNGCVDLIGAPPNGILNLLDHQCRAPQASESSFCMSVNLKHKDSNFFAVPRRTKTCPLDQSEGFIVKHYAGEVLDAE